MAAAIAHAAAVSTGQGWLSLFVVSTSRTQTEAFTQASRDPSHATLLWMTYASDVETVDVPIIQLMLLSD